LIWLLYTRLPPVKVSCCNMKLIFMKRMANLITQPPLSLLDMVCSTLGSPCLYNTQLLVLLLVLLVVVVLLLLFTMSHGW
jgi:hypothetical protein